MARLVPQVGVKRMLRECQGEGGSSGGGGKWMVL